MKKLLAVTLLMLALVLAVVSCDLLPSGSGSTNDGVNLESTTKAPETTAVPETTAPETTEAETTEAETPEEETTPEETTPEETTPEETTEEVTTPEETTEEVTTPEETTAKPRPKPQTTAEPETTVEPETTEEETTEEETTEEETTVELIAPEGYKMYQYEDIAFAYPEDWTLSNQYGVLVIIRDTDSGNNITLAAEPYTGLYDNMTVEMFNQYIKPQYDSLGMTLSDINIEKETVNGLDVTVIGHITRYSGQTLYQTSFYFTVGDVTYAIAVTENPPEPGLAGTVFNSIIAIGYTPEPEPDTGLEAPEGYLVYQSGTLAFLYPNTWLNVEGTLMYATPDGQMGGIIVVQQDNQYAIFHTLTAQEYMDIMGPSLEAQGQQLASVEIDKTTVNGLTVTVIEQVNIAYDTSVYQAMLVVTVEDTTYLVVYSAPSKDADVLNAVLNSLTAID